MFRQTSLAVALRRSCSSLNLRGELLDGLGVGGIWNIYKVVDFLTHSVFLIFGIYQ